jgi:hypothetical protein
VESGKAVPVEIFKMEGMGENVTDTITLTISEQSVSGAGTLQLAGLKVAINGEPIPNQNSASAVSGRYAMFYVPGQGGYFFATSPTPGLVEAGSIDGRRMEFTIDNVSVECTAEAPILAGSGNGQLWVRHDTGYHPQGRWTEPLGPPGPPKPPGFFAAASNTLAWWIP